MLREVGYSRLSYHAPLLSAKNKNNRLLWEMSVSCLFLFFFKFILVLPENCRLPVSTNHSDHSPLTSLCRGLLLSRSFFFTILWNSMHGILLHPMMQNLQLLCMEIQDDQQFFKIPQLRSRRSPFWGLVLPLTLH